ncbi:MAG: hypothetical protein RIN55_07825 [Tissierellaceae bacterium]|nr:hypothetical protein [Tissierellaceae bacterium]
MHSVYLFLLLIMFFVLIIYRSKDIKAVRVFGFELTQLLVCIFFTIVIIGEFIVPIPQYHIKNKLGEERNLNEVLEEETLRAGIEFDEGSFKVLDSRGMNFNHLFLCSYEIDGEQEVRYYHFEKNIFGHMKLKDPLGDIDIITNRNNSDDHYRAYVRDGIFGEYMITVGYGDESEPINYGLNDYIISKTPPKGYFVWVELAQQPWKSNLIEFIILFLIINIISKFQKNKREPVKFYNKWRKWDKWYTIDVL